MCGRFVLSVSSVSIKKTFSLGSCPIFSPSYNIAPTQKILAILGEEESSLNPLSENNKWKSCFLHWGLIPSWAKNSKNSSNLINARLETLGVKPSFKQAFSQRRCLIPANGFYEWNQEVYGKNPLLFYKTNKEVFAFAGLWEKWQSPTGEIIESATIINTQARGIMAEIHPRMPIILKKCAYQIWLDKSIQDPKLLSEILQSNLKDNLHFYPVNEAVNSVKNNYPELLEPEKVSKQLSLFQLKKF
ncbi:SOS response-associated peptidase [Cyanobacterium aponinum FACHB-4101]|uniref:SOS response-associated peptidase n=1 Tax=Cyanobacterium aponinum TaxID=379064 RepID=UPI0016817963|nr:SOS response-associated peptidase [Cyanobacterium aponinum]MBD2395038.1 SOS response-associated peptidase [Cyanobacterium aponinum FACHB-4101]